MNNEVNYHDLLKEKNVSQYFSYLNRSYVNLVGAPIKVFKLDKHKTVLDDLYGQEKHSRIYLPHFTMRAIYQTNPWQGLLGTFPFNEKEDNTKIIVNFDEMVNQIRDLKNKNKAELKIQYNGTLNPSIEKKEGKIFFYLNDKLIKEINLQEIRTFQKLCDELKKIQGVQAECDHNEETMKIDNFYKTSFNGKVFLLYVRDIVYDELTDVIEMGDILITEKWRVYEVRSADPTGDMGWGWSTFTLDCNLIEIDLLDGLPGNMIAEVKRHQHGLKKVHRE